MPYIINYIKVINYQHGVIIKPSGAIRMLKLVEEFGLWPNDAIMCRQLFPDLYVTRKFYTTIQNLKSTTTQ